MKESIITINVPSGKVAKQTTDENGNIIIKFVDSGPTRSKSWEEFCKNHPSVKFESFINQHGGIDFRTDGPRNANNVNNLATVFDAKGILTLIQLTRLHDEWVGNWKPDYSLKLDGCIPYAIKYDGQGYDIVESSCHNILEFPSPEMAEEFLEHFEDLIDKAKKFI